MKPARLGAGFFSRREDSMIRKELTASEVARLAGCSRQQVMRAILSAKLRARKVGREALIWDEDAEAFATFRAHRKLRGS
jgi:excisionase family DNA binding protein